MFKSNKTNERKPHRDGEVPPSIIASDTKITAEGVFSTGEVHIDGTVEGKIVAREVMVGRDAKVKGDITAALVRLNGTVFGKINAEEVNLLLHAHVEGDITHNTISIEAGAYFEGKSIRKNAKKSEVPVAVNPTEVMQLTHDKQTTTRIETAEKSKTPVTRDMKAVGVR
ncbi:MAG: polymer-forming cytoskeletal protein [Alphaproteobacteria bacterium]|nr:polymer-forming cytoskeletal protein [Alphaproteobacteria bacterium]